MTTIDDGWAGSEGLMHDTPPHPSTPHARISNCRNIACSYQRAMRSDGFGEDGGSSDRRGEALQIFPAYNEKSSLGMRG